MTRFAVFALFVLPLMGEDPIRGFPETGWKARRELEQKLRALPDPEKMRIYMQRMSSEPHHAGSPGSMAVAEYAVGLLREWGIDARIEAFEALLPYPTVRTLELVAPVKYKAKLKESPIREDKDSTDPGQLPPYNAYSASGDVTGQLVYVNYGIPEDYERLKQMGIVVKGKIVIARYGAGWRGTKAKVAQENGAIACLIYSDPRDDGYFQGDTYPKGPFRPPQSVQRGSVMDMPLYVGDPLSPGWASERGSKRLKREDAPTIMKIPVLPISYEDAAPLLENLAGPVAPEPWRGALPFTYHVGPGPAIAHLKVDFDWSTRPIYNVIATIPGSTWPNQWVIYGNHHDAWVNGASDPISGAIVVLETARALAELRKQGWRPQRTIKLALWDGEEFGLVGSTEWVEKHQAELDRKAVAYLNTDTNGKGKLRGEGSPVLQKFFEQVARDVQDPVSSKSVLEEGGKAADFRLGAPGAGSDYVAFEHHTGIASLNTGFSGSGAGVYHSIYDSFAWYTKFSDPQFLYGKALTQVMGTALLRLADAPVLPFDFTGFAKNVRAWSGDLPKLAETKGGKIDLGAINDELARLDSAAAGYETALTAALGRTDVSPAELGKWNEAIFRSERALLSPAGLPGRDWYKNEMYAPGLYTGYGAKTLPAVREAVESAKWEEANSQVKNVAQALRAMQERIAEAARMLGGS
jgi:N-acetylated-alpha-linked acidic dipeptidase